jgi:hypothetical protein
MAGPTPLTPTDELLAELVGEVRGLGDLLRDRLPEPPAPQDRTGTVELREPARSVAPATRQPPAEPTTPPVALPPAKRVPARKAAPRRAGKASGTAANTEGPTT